MKLRDLQVLHEKSTEDSGSPPPVKSGETVSTSQAAKMLGVTMGRIRQLIADGQLKTQISPEKGSRDHEILLKDVEQLKDSMPKKGRPFKSGKKETDAHGKVVTDKK